MIKRVDIFDEFTKALITDHKDLGEAVVDNLQAEADKISELHADGIISLKEASISFIAHCSRFSLITREAIKNE